MAHAPTTTASQHLLRCAFTSAKMFYFSISRVNSSLACEQAQAQCRPRKGGFPLSRNFYLRKDVNFN